MDWLTLSISPDNKDFSAIQARFARIIEELQSDGHEVKRSQWQGYTGYQVRSLFCGVREDGFIIRASNREAGLVESEFRRSGWDAKCTRLDLQCTIRTAEGEAENYLSELQSSLYTRAQERGHNKILSLAVYRVAGSNTGVSIGSRSSGRYQRIYNKSLEQKNRIASDLVRFEVEFKGQQARLMFKMLMSAASGRWLALSIVKTSFEIYDIDMSFLTQCKPEQLPSSYNPSDDERRLNWLESHVKRTVHQLMKTQGRDAVLKALALDSEKC